MRNKIITIWWIILCISLHQASAGVYYNDGEVHNIDFFVDDFVVVNDNLGGGKTTLNLLSGGRIGEDIYAHDYSEVNVLGGSIGGNGRGLKAYENSKIIISGGSIGLLHASANSIIEIRGGAINSELKAEQDSQISIFGGSIGDVLRVADNSIVTIRGTGFNYPFGTITNDFGLLTGISTNGDIIDNWFSVTNNGSITLSPPGPTEPTDPPIADAGADIIADANEVVILDASASYDPDGNIVQYMWAILPENEILYSGPNNTTASKCLGRVEEVIKLTVTDDKGALSQDTMSIFSKKVEEIELTPGPQGEQGLIGPKGDTGDTGLQGIQGPAGITPEEIADIQAQIIALQQVKATLLQQVEALEQQNILLQQQIDENRYLLDQLPQLQKKTEP